jgi:hypothetical protein
MSTVSRRLIRELLIKTKKGWICALKTHDRDVYVLIEKETDLQSIQGIFFLKQMN